MPLFSHIQIFFVVFPEAGHIMPEHVILKGFPVIRLIHGVQRRMISVVILFSYF